jgi:hypothetical protein
MRSVQDWEEGINYPAAPRLQALIAALLGAGGMAAGRATEEAEQLWTAVLRESPRMHTPLDHDWLNKVLTGPGARGSHVAPEAAVSDPGERRHDWGDAPDVLRFLGRAEELGVLREWVLQDRCRVVAMLGLGGIGKTMLATRLAHDVAPGFQRVYWRSLRNAPSASEWLGGAIGFLSGQQLVPPESDADRLPVLQGLLADRPSLLVLDNFETVLEPGEREGQYRDGFAAYSSVLQALVGGRHQSCLVLTSRETPLELAIASGTYVVRTLELGGLGLCAAQGLLADKQLWGDDADWTNLITHFGGNGLALNMVGERIRQVFGAS